MPEPEATAAEGPSLREIAQTLTTPARGGMVLTKERLGRLAAALSLPVGISERSQMLVNMFRAAAELQAVPALLRALQDEAARWAARYAGWSEEYPASAAIWREWQARLAATRALLEEMAATVGGQVDIVEPDAARVVPGGGDGDEVYED